MDSSRLLTLRTANDAIAAGKRLPRPEPLFGPFWNEGEFAVLCGEHGVGKSVLAVQIGNSLSKGLKSSWPFENKAGQRNVLYLDFEMTDKQFEMRYAAATDDETNVPDGKTRHHAFSHLFYRPKIDLSIEVPAEYGSLAEFLVAEIETLMDETRAKVVIVDNVNCLAFTQDGARQTVELMRHLKRLRDRREVSILAVADLSRRATARPISLADLHGWRYIAHFADSIFALGDSSLGHDVRYLKPLRQRSSERSIDQYSVPGLMLSKHASGFLAFNYTSFNTELTHLRDANAVAAVRCDRIAEVYRLTGEGKKQRQIAAELGISAASVNRYARQGLACQYVECPPTCTHNPATAFGYAARNQANQCDLHRSTETEEIYLKARPAEIALRE